MSTTDNAAAMVDSDSQAAPVKAEPMDTGSEQQTQQTLADQDTEHASKKRKREDTTSESAASSSSSSAPSSAAAAVAPVVPVLLGKAGGDAIRQGIVQAPPAQYITQFQKDHGIKVAGIDASLSFLDLFAPKRGVIYGSILVELCTQLTSRIRSGGVSVERQVQLLEASFAYLRVEELSSVPLALLLSLCRANALPPKYLKALASSPERLIESLPLEVRRRLMEAEPDKHFWSTTHMRNLLAAYANDATRTEEYATLLPTENVAPALRKVRAALPAAGTRSTVAPSPSAVALHGILEWIGPSARLYKVFCSRLRDLCTACEATGASSDVWRALRVDLLMRVHDLESQTPTTTTGADAATSSSFGVDTSSSTPAGSLFAHAVDPLHTWAWCLDASAKQVVSFDPKLLERLLGGDAEGTEAGFLPGLHAKTHTLHDLALLAGHPFTIAALLRGIHAALLQVVELESTPKDHPHLTPLTRMLHLATSASSELATVSADAAAAGASGVTLPEFASLPALFDEFYPLMVELAIYAQLGETEPIGDRLLAHASETSLARAVYMHYLLTRMQAQDVQQTSVMLVTLPKLTHDGVSVWTTAAQAGEQQLLHALLHTATTLLVGMKSSLHADLVFRELVFADCFLPLAALSPYAHLECVRLLAACDECMSAEELARYAAKLPKQPTADEVKAEQEITTNATATNDSPAPHTTIQAQLTRAYDHLRSIKPTLFAAASSSPA